MQYVTLSISIITAVICVLTFFFNRNGDTKKDGKEEKKEAETNSYKWGKWEEKLDNLTKQVDKILDKLEAYDKEFDEKIDKAIAEHERIYHNNK